MITNLWHMNPKWHANVFPWYAAFTAVRIYFARSASLYCEKHAYIHISVCAENVYELPLLPNNSRMKHFYTNRDMDIHHWDVSLAVSGQIRDIGQRVLQSSFQKGSSGSSISYFQIILLIAFLGEAIY